VVCDKGYVIWDMWYVICGNQSRVERPESGVESQGDRIPNQRLNDSTTQPFNYIYPRVHFPGGGCLYQELTVSLPWLYSWWCEVFICVYLRFHFMGIFFA